MKKAFSAFFKPSRGSKCHNVLMRIFFPQFLAYRLEKNSNVDTLNPEMQAKEHCRVTMTRVVESGGSYGVVFKYGIKRRISSTHILT